MWISPQKRSCIRYTPSLQDGGIEMHDQHSLGQVVRRAQTGDPKAFEQLARQFLRGAYAVALSIVRRPSDAEDVAQDAFVLALEKIQTCREPDRFAGWLMQIVRNQAKNHLLRRKFRDVTKEDPQDLPTGESPDLRDPQLQEELLRALHALTPPEREVVLLHDLEGWTHPEISKATEHSEVMSRQHLFQARKKLKKALNHFQEKEKDHGS